MPATQYNINPAPQTGQGAYGAVPGAIGIPPNKYEGIMSIYPALSGQLTNAGGVINSQLAGELDTNTLNSLWDTANTYGVASGMSGGRLSSNSFLGNVAGSKQALQQKGISNVEGIAGALSPLVTDPNLAADVASRNATFAAAPNPAAAAADQWSKYMKALQYAATAARGPAGGTGGGAGAPAAAAGTGTPGGWGGSQGSGGAGKDQVDKNGLTAADYKRLGLSSADFGGNTGAAGTTGTTHTNPWAGVPGTIDPWANLEDEYGFTAADYQGMRLSSEAADTTGTTGTTGANPWAGVPGTIDPWANLDTSATDTSSGYTDTSSGYTDTSGAGMDFMDPNMWDVSAYGP